MYEAFSYYICVFIYVLVLLYMCPHMCPHAAMLCMCPQICDLMLLYMCLLIGTPAVAAVVGAGEGIYREREP